jgi:hypothetical protein
MNLCIALSVVRALLQQYASNGNEQNNHNSVFGRPTKEPLEKLCRMIRNNSLREKVKKTQNSSEGIPGQFGQVSSEIHYCIYCYLSLTIITAFLDHGYALIPET